MDQIYNGSAKEKVNSNGAKIIADQDISWFKESSDPTPEAFFDKFGITKREYGHLRYARALHRSNLSKQERALLIVNFDEWKRSKSQAYWERRNTKEVAKKTAWKTAGKIIGDLEPFVRTIIDENAKEQTRYSAVVYDLPPACDTEPSIPRSSRTSNTPNLIPSADFARKDHSKRTKTATAQSLPKKRIRLRDPWHDLAEIAVQLFKGNTVDLPLEDTSNTEDDPVPGKLYKLAWRHLKDAKRAIEQQTTSKEGCLHLHDAFVALSGVFNLYSPVARTTLSTAERLDAKSLCIIPELESKDEEVTRLLNSLKITKTKKLTAVLEDVYSCLGSKPAFRLFLLVLRNIIENILDPHHGDNEPSESDALLIWGSILKDGRPKGTPFTFHFGERASHATRVSKSKLACALNTGCGARKCNCILSIGKTQFGNGGVTRASTPPVAVKIQLRKNIKIARSVMLELSKFGLDCPPQLSIHGLKVDIFRVMPWKGVFVAAPACNAIVLPKTEAAWNLFIDNGAHQLKNLLEYYHEYTVDANEKIDIFNYTQNTVGQDEEGEGTGIEHGSDLAGIEVEDDDGLDKEIEHINWRDVIFRTPTKPTEPKAARTMVGISTPNNQRFQQGMQKVMAELEHDHNVIGEEDEL
ncbi:hypothetical protein EMPS_04095 [Entomortierella parvispora]|uniref:Uncharacterized protein n=1 Tax=Entomortierella parvispora TaxID=205924 RepID=A0A9P3LV55_9FUNG|nr:hypothetical protein EMPS_04095 [Entomortierella parvispora]